MPGQILHEDTVVNPRFQVDARECPERAPYKSQHDYRASTHDDPSPKIATPLEHQRGRHHFCLAPADMGARRGTIPSLDGLRAISIALVVLGHIVSPRFFPGGLGVLVFFVISGFLITRLSIAEIRSSGRLNIYDFYMRRIFRLYPVVIAYTLTIVSTAALAGWKLNWIEPLSALFYFSNYLYSGYSVNGTTPSMPFKIFWSLSIEEHFYIVFPFFILLVRKNAKALIFGASTVILIALALRLGIAHSRPDLLEKDYFYYRTEFRADAIAWGVLLAALCETRLGRDLVLLATRPAAGAIALALLLISLAWRDVWFRETVRYSLLAATSFVVIASVVFSDRYILLNRLLNSTPAVYIGKLSYSLYVWHYGAFYFLGTADLRGCQRMLALFALSALLANLSYFAIEQPSLKLRRRFRPDK